MSKEIKELLLKESENFRDRLINLVSKLTQFDSYIGDEKEIAYFIKDELKNIYKTYSLYKHTKNTITSFDRLISNLNKVKKNGFSINEAETFDYVYGIGSAILEFEILGAIQLTLIFGASSAANETVNPSTPPLAVDIML